MLARDPGELGEVGRVAGHAVDAVHADQPALGRVLGGSSSLEVVGVLEAEPLDGRRRGARADLAAVVDRLVGARVEEDRAAGRRAPESPTMWMCVIVGSASVSSAAEQLGQPLLDLLVQHRAAEQPRPARMRAPRVEGRGSRR